MGEFWTYPDGYDSQFYSYYDPPGDLRAYETAYSGSRSLSFRRRP